MRVTANPVCPCCLSHETRKVLEFRGIPVNNTTLFHDPCHSKEVARGDLELFFCETCGFLFNAAFDEGLTLYSETYEETQGFSGTFQKFHSRLADDLCARLRIQGKHILEIGCGKGEFLALLCQDGRNSGVGMDPAFDFSRHPDPDNPSISFKAELVTEHTDLCGFDVVCCKMTLEHIPRVRDFLTTLTKSLGEQEVTFFFQVPDTSRVLMECAFWDIYYEHCSYFTAGSLRWLFESCGLLVDEVWTDYDDQYLMIAAQWSGSPTANEVENPDLRGVKALVDDFGRTVQSSLRKWSACLDSDSEVALWGGGSKAVAFLSALPPGERKPRVVDINPYKQGTFLAGTTCSIIAPVDLVDRPPEKIILMNPIYLEEVQESLDELGLESELLLLQ